MGKDDSQDSRENKGTIFVPFLRFYTLTNIQSFISSFAYEVSSIFSTRARLKKIKIGNTEFVFSSMKLILKSLCQKSNK